MPERVALNKQIDKILNKQREDMETPYKYTTALQLLKHLSKNYVEFHVLLSTEDKCVLEVINGEIYDINSSTMNVISDRFDTHSPRVRQTILYHRCILRIYKDLVGRKQIPAIETNNVSDRVLTTNFAIQAQYAEQKEKDIVGMLKARGIVEIKNILNKKPKDMNTIDKLKRLRDNNPNFADAIETEFPEIVDNEPYVYAGDIFMRKDHAISLYIVIHDSNTCDFLIRNVLSNKDWQGSQRRSSNDLDSPAYLNKTDFKKLIKQSQVRIETVEIVKRKHLVRLHKEVFNEI